MSRTKQPYRDFDLPVKHLGESDHFVPPKARDAEEIGRRRRLRSGGLLAEYQSKGIQVAAKVLDFAAREAVNDDFIVSTLAAAEFNTAWYNYSAGVRDVMRRRLKLPRHDQDIFGLDAGVLIAAGRDDLLATNFAANFLIRYPGMPRFTKQLGIQLGDASLRLASISRLDELQQAGQDGFMIQEITRSAALRMVETSRHMHAEVNSNPSLAQLADPDSHLSHYWRVNGSNFAVEALRFATSS